MMGKKEIADDINFVRFTKATKDQLEFETTLFQEVPFLGLAAAGRAIESRWGFWIF